MYEICVKKLRLLRIVDTGLRDLKLQENSYILFYYISLPTSVTPVIYVYITLFFPIVFVPKYAS
jgi:hypothetical protein